MATASDPNVVALQQEINRFANDPDIGFTPIACDGQVGPDTLAGALYALTSIQLGAGVSVDTQNEAGNLINSLNAPADVAANLFDLTQTLQAGALQLSAASYLSGNYDPSYIDCPATTSKAPPKPTTTRAQQVISQYGQTRPTLSSNFLGLPTWALATGGGAIALGVLYFVFARKRRGGRAGSTMKIKRAA